MRQHVISVKNEVQDELRLLDGVFREGLRD